MIGLMWAHAYSAFLGGYLKDAAETLDHIIVYSQNVGIEGYGREVEMHIGLRLRVYLGNAVDHLENTLQKMLQEEANAPIHQIILFIMACLGKAPETTERLDRMLASRSSIDSLDDTTNLNIDIFYLEAAVLANHRQAAEALLNRLTSHNTSSQITTGSPTCVARHLGSAAALLGRPDEARVHYQDALKVANEMRFRPELALTRLQLAELLLEHYPDEKKEALEHLDFTITEFREMKMQPSLERALRHKEILGA